MKDWQSLFPFPDSEARFEKIETDFMIHAAIEIGSVEAAEGVLLHYRIQARDEATFGRIRDLETTLEEVISERVHGLWEDTCFECFFAGNGTEYFEFNGTADGRWNLFHFDSYRSGMKESAVPVGSEPSLLAVEKTQCIMTLTWFIPFLVLPTVDDEIRAGLTVVLACDTRNSYWAIKHLGDQADFHRPGSFLAQRITSSKI